MTPPPVRPQFTRLVTGSRIFGFVLLSIPILSSNNSTAMLALLSLGVVWLAATAADRLRIPEGVVITSEAALIGAICALSFTASLAVLVALSLSPFTAGLRRGPHGVAMALSAQLVTLVVVSAAVSGPMGTDPGVNTLTWAVAGLGLGLIGSFLRTAMHSAADPLIPYRDAQALIRELIDLSGGLSSGLDPDSLAGTIVTAVRDELPVTDVAVHVPRDDVLTALNTTPVGQSNPSTRLADLAGDTWRTGEVRHARDTFAFPLATDAGLVAIVSGQLPSGHELVRPEIDRRLERASEQLAPTAVQLDTALMFQDFRNAATSDERKRLARELHDGIAQDIASLGYVVDWLATQPSSPAQAQQLKMIRERITAIVAEVRRSVLSLRTGIGSNPSLGAAIGALARQLTDSSGLSIHVTADEGATRLPPEVEAELLRIAQEAMNNAVRHAKASTIRVHCRVAPPAAEIVVSDDGSGLGPARDDSFGLGIMHERAGIIGATLSVGAAEPHGTVVKLTLTGQDTQSENGLSEPDQPPNDRTVSV